MDKNYLYASNLDSLTCRELRDRLRSLQESIDENRRHARRQSLDRGLRSVPISSRVDGFLPFGRPASVDLLYENPPSVFSSGSSGESSVCISGKRPLTAFDQNGLDSARPDGRLYSILTPPASRQSRLSPLASAPSQKSSRSRSVHFKDTQTLMSEIERNYPKFVTLLEPIVLKADSEIGSRTLKALRRRAALCEKTLKRTQKSILLASAKRREKLELESIEAYRDRLVCLSLIEEISRVFFPTSDKFPTPLRTVHNQMHHLQQIFSVYWGPAV